MPPQFTKFHGLGNDYLVIETEQLAGIDGIRSTETLVELRFVKESYQWGAR